MDRLSRFAWIVLAYTVPVILWGAAVRATGSGAGCGNHWPLCNGEVAPGIEKLIELTHRLSSGAALVLVVAVAVAAYRRRPAGDLTRKAAAASVVLMLTEAAVGAALVHFRLVTDNASMVRVLVMATHLVNTFLLLAAMTLTAHFAGGAALRLRSRGLGLGLACGLLGLLLSGVSGALAALADTLFPAASLTQALRQDLSAGGHLLIRLRLLHPAIAVAAGILVLFLALAPAAPRTASWQRWGRRSAGLVFLQWLAGLANAALLTPVWLQLVHLLLADLLWIAVVMLAAAALGADAGEESGLPLYSAEAAPP